MLSPSVELLLLPASKNAYWRPDRSQTVESDRPFHRTDTNTAVTRWKGSVLDRWTDPGGGPNAQGGAMAVRAVISRTGNSPAVSVCCHMTPKPVAGETYSMMVSSRLPSPTDSGRETRRFGPG